MADVTISQLSLVAPKGDGFIPISQDNSTVRTLASSLTANCLSESSRYSVEYLVIGGGGGGGQDYAGCGGAGGFVEGNMYINVGDKYQVVVGRGGRKDLQSYWNENGGDSIFGSIRAFGGGAGQSNTNRRQANNGGSGGGCGYQYDYIGYGIDGQGYEGIIAGSFGYTAGGAGGGAGGRPSPSTRYIGGPGKYSSITGTNTLYASGGSHLGNLGSTGRPDAAPNTGFGGNGAYGSWSVSNNGSSGIVIIAYTGTPRGTAYTYQGTTVPADTASRPGYTVHKFLQGGYYIA